MKRTFWVRGQRRFFGFCWLGFLIVALPIINLAEILSANSNLIELAILDGFCFSIFAAVALEIFVQRVEVQSWGIQAFDLLNRAKPPLPFEEMTAYQRTPGGEWILSAGEEVYKLPRIDKQQFHAVIAEFAPKALDAKLWKCGQLPPTQDFTGLSAFDFNLWMVNLVGTMAIALIFSLVSRLFALFYFFSSFFQVSYDLKNLVGKLSLTTEGVAVKWPWSKTNIDWEEITAVFCERNGNRWTYFVVTAPGRSVVIPSHILADPEVRRKFFYNIPDQTRCVNFDKMKFRRRGRGKKIFSPDEAVGYSLDPQLAG